MLCSSIWNHFIERKISMTNEIKKEPYVLSSVKNALRILNSYSLTETEKSISELSTSLGMGKSTVSRLMSTLASEGFVIKDPRTHKYRLGLSVLTLGGVIKSNITINKEAAPVVHQLVNQIGETAHLAILDGTDTIYIHKEECNHPVRILTSLGRRNPAYCTSSGKVLLAFNDSSLVDALIESGLKPIQKNTITDPNKLMAEIKQVKKDGYASSISELTEGVVSVAAPVRDYTGKVCAAITVVGPVQRIPKQKIPYFGKKVIEASKEASIRMGYNPRFLNTYS